MLNIFSGDSTLPYDIELEPKIISIANKRLDDSYRFVSHVVTLNSSVVVALGGLALAGASNNRTIRHPYLLVGALSVLLISVAMGAFFLYLSSIVASVTAMYWATIQRRRELAKLDRDYQEHFDAGDFTKHKNIEWHREVHEKLPDARNAIVAAYPTVQNVERFYYGVEALIVLTNIAGYVVLVVFVARSI